MCIECELETDWLFKEPILSSTETGVRITYYTYLTDDFIRFAKEFDLLKAGGLKRKAKLRKTG